MPVLLILVILVALVLQRYFVRRAQDVRNIRYECKPSVRACEPGDVFLVHSDLSNTGYRESAALYIEEHFPRELKVLEAGQYNIVVLRNDCRLYNSSAVIGARQQVKRSLRASIDRRGEYRFSYAEFYAADFLGMREYYYRKENDSRIVIYPKRIENEAFLQSFSTAADEIARNKQLLEDPISVCGYDPYTGREPMRAISWTQSAVRNELIVKRFDPVWQRSVRIVLDLQYHGEFDYNFERQELCFSIARTVCEDLERRQIGYRFITNAALSGGISSFTSEGGMGGSYRKILYALGIARAGAVCSLKETMLTACADAARQELIVFIATRQDEDVSRELARVKARCGVQIVTLFADALLPTKEGGTDA